MFCRKIVTITSELEATGTANNTSLDPANNLIISITNNRNQLHFCLLSGNLIQECFSVLNGQSLVTPEYLLYIRFLVENCNSLQNLQSVWQSTTHSMRVTKFVESQTKTKGYKVG